MALSCRFSKQPPVTSDRVRVSVHSGIQWWYHCHEGELLKACTFERCCFFAPDYSNQRICIQLLLFTSKCIYNTDGLVARLSLNLFWYSKELKGCLEAWMKAFIQLIYPQVQSYLQCLSKVRRASNVQWTHIFKARMSCHLKNNLLPAFKKYCRHNNLDIFISRLYSQNWNSVPVFKFQCFVFKKK